MKGVRSWFKGLGCGFIAMTQHGSAGSSASRKLSNELLKLWPTHTQLCAYRIYTHFGSSGFHLSCEKKKSFWVRLFSSCETSFRHLLWFRFDPCVTRVTFVHVGKSGVNPPWPQIFISSVVSAAYLSTVSLHHHIMKDTHKLFCLSSLIFFQIVRTNRYFARESKHKCPFFPLSDIVFIQLSVKKKNNLIVSLHLSRRNTSGKQCLTSTLFP